MLRSSYDLDIVLELHASNLSEFLAAFQHDFELNSVELLDALRVAPFEQLQLQRRIRQMVATNPDAEADFASPEDIILAKLEWFRLGNYASAHQWTDIQAIILVQEERLDWPYLRTWASNLGVRDLLDRLIAGERTPTNNPSSQQQRLFD